MANILIVEDEKKMQEIIVEYMQRGGHICFTADDGIDALVVLKSNPMDLMILDIMMPNLDGFSVCKIAREMSNLPIIMLTAKGSEDDNLKAYEPKGTFSKGKCFITTFLFTSGRYHKCRKNFSCSCLP